MRTVRRGQQGGDFDCPQRLAPIGSNGGAGLRLSRLWPALVAPAFLLLPACASHRPYPGAWEPLPSPPAEDCRHFEGSYRNRGETTPGDQELTLAELFFWDRPSVAELTSDTRVSLSLPTDGVLIVTVGEGTGAFPTRTLDRPKDFTCEAGRLVIRYGSDIGSDMGYLRTRTTVTLVTAGDHLVAHLKVSEFGILFLVPASHKTLRWYRFQRERGQSQDG